MCRAQLLQGLRSPCMTATMARAGPPRGAGQEDYPSSGSMSTAGADHLLGQRANTQLQPAAPEAKPRRFTQASCWAADLDPASLRQANTCLL